jgi:hypothetical protein
MRIVKHGRVVHHADGTHTCSNFEVDHYGDGEDGTELLSLDEAMEFCIADPEAEHIYEGED